MSTSESSPPEAPELREPKEQPSFAKAKTNPPPPGTDGDTEAGDAAAATGDEAAAKSSAATDSAATDSAAKTSDATDATAATTTNPSTPDAAGSPDPSSLDKGASTNAPRPRDGSPNGYAAPPTGQGGGYGAPPGYVPGGYGPPGQGPGGYGPGGYGPPGYGPPGYGAPPGPPPPFQRPPGWVEPDPFKNARGLSGMFSKREGTMPLWPFMIAAVGIIGVISLRLQLASNAKAERDRQFEQIYQNQKFNNGYGGYKDPYGGSQYGGPSYGNGGTGALAPSITELETKARKVCTKLVQCQGADPSMSQEIVSSCIRQEIAPATTDPMMRSAVGEILDGIENTCGAKSCDQYTDCMFEKLGADGAKLSGGDPGQPVSPADRKRMKDLVCELAALGPDGANTSPKNAELQALMIKIGPAQAAKVMKEVVNECEPGGGAPKAGDDIPF